MNNKPKTQENYKPVSIDMNTGSSKVNKSGKKLVLRYCASELSIPNNATDVSRLFRNNYDHNKYTNLAYGYSYWIEEEGMDTSTNIRNIEKDKIFENIGDNYFTNFCPQHMFSYETFTEYYSDEKFPPYTPYIEINDDGEIITETQKELTDEEFDKINPFLVPNDLNNSEKNENNKNTNSVDSDDDNNFSEEEVEEEDFEEVF
jgi:hypothetical protein